MDDIKKHNRRTFATDTFKKIINRSAYYRKILSAPKPDNFNNANDKARYERQISKIKTKYEHDMKVRALLHRAIRHLYE